MRISGVRTVRLPALALAASALALLAAGCGDDDSADDAGSPAPEASAFPAVDGRSLEQIVADSAPADDLVVSPAGQVFTEGRNRLGFGVFTVERDQLTDAEVAIYAAPGPDGEAQGPFPARVESLETEPAFTAENTANDPDAAKAVYVSEMPLDEPGEWRMIALVERDGEFAAVQMPSAVVVRNDPVPDPGDRAPVVHTPTADDVPNIQDIDTRIPPGTMHEDDLASVLGKEPVILLFATPALCQSRVCGPVVDIAEQVKRDRPDDAAYIHMEIYNDNLANEGLRPQVEAYNLPTEPWLFAIDCDGKVDSRIEGAFSAAELNQAIDQIQDSC
ncbi:MAG TPA: hypothetical protein VFY37_04665 [Solirubrobacterales bacterium]|nr:hypothetical protein [Solirubrobacterales bacterium]